MHRRHNPPINQNLLKFLFYNNNNNIALNSQWEIQKRIVSRTSWIVVVISSYVFNLYSGVFIVSNLWLSTALPYLDEFQITTTSFSHFSLISSLQCFFISSVTNFIALKNRIVYFSYSTSQLWNRMIRKQAQVIALAIMWAFNSEYDYVL